VTSTHQHQVRRAALAAAGLSLLALTACSSSSAAKPAAGDDGAAAAATVSSPAGAGSSPVDGCTLVTAPELSATTGVKYTAVADSGTGSICNVTGASPADSFYFHVDKEDGVMTTWKSEVATVKEDDGSATSVSGIGDQAIQGAVKEFAAESGGYIVVVANADVNNPATASSFTRTRKIEQLLISKL
jgi:hypothetical protein